VRASSLSGLNPFLGKGRERKEGKRNERRKRREER
jgi:hypothetical protein